MDKQTKHHSAKQIEYKGELINSTDHPLYHTWEAMKQRCYYKNADNYHLYGGRGITVCDRWLNSFKNFYEDMGDKPEPIDDYTLDRKDVDGNYEPSNCRWATWSEQHINKRITPVSGYNWIYVKNGNYVYRRVINKKLISLKTTLNLEDTIAIGKEFEKLLEQNKDYSHLLAEPIQAEFKSLVTGVYWRSDIEKYRVRRLYNGKKVNLGVYSDINEAEYISLEWDRRLKEEKSIEDMIYKKKEIKNKSRYKGVYYITKGKWLGTITILGKNYSTRSVGSEEEAYQLREQLKVKFNYYALKNIKEIEFDFKTLSYKIIACKLIPFTPIYIGNFKNKVKAEKYLEYIYSNEYKQKYYHVLEDGYIITIYHLLRNIELTYIKVNNAEYYIETNIKDINEE